MLAIRLPETIEKRLEKLAQRTGRTKTFYAREAILVHLADLEDLYLAEHRLERIQSREERILPLQEVLKRRGLDRGNLRERVSRTRQTRPATRSQNLEIPPR